MSASFERGINAMREVMDAPIASFFSSCVHCGLCAEACLFYTETGNPRYTPINKVKPLRKIWRQEYTLLGKLGSMLGLSSPVTDQELQEWSTIVYDSCTMCGRCSMVCPVGNDIAYMIRKIREGMSAAGHAPPGMIGAAKRTVEIGSPMGVKVPALMSQIKAQAAETGLDVPVDKEGAEYLVLLSSMEIMNFPEYIGALARIFNKAGVTWTISTDAYEATNSGIQIGSSDIARVIVKRIVDAAEKLKVKAVISPECGHAFQAIRYDAPNLLGKPLNFEVIHILEVLDNLRAAGKLKLKGKDTRQITYHDPCQIARRGGVIEQPRRLLDMVADNFTEMEDAGKMNWCCAGGGGVSANERAEGLKMKAFGVKKRQLEDTGADTLVTACANCRITLEEGMEHYHMEDNWEVIGLTELLAEYLDDE